MNITFIRHSRTKIEPLVPITCWGLSEEGIQLAKDLSHSHVIKDLDVIYASFQTKALETAVYLAKPNAIPIKADNNLTEVTSFTKSFEADQVKYNQSIHEYYLGKIERIHGGETQQEALARFMKALENIVAAEKNKKVGIVSHGNVLTLFSAQFKSIDPFELHTSIKQPDVAIFDWEKKQFLTFFGDEV